jgi:hypothetical protein
LQGQSTYQRGCCLSAEDNDAACLGPSYGSQSAMHDEAADQIYEKRRDCTYKSRLCLLIAFIQVSILCFIVFLVQVIFSILGHTSCMVIYSSKCLPLASSSVK